MKKFIQKVFLLSTLLATILIGVNYFGDVALLFHSDHIKMMSQILKSGKNVTNIANYNERLFQKEVVKNFKTSPDILIIGSSRTMLINSDCFKNKSIFNCSVSGASIEDLVSIYQLYKSNHIIPKTILLGIDPWIFNKNNDLQRWQSLKSEYYNFLNENKISEVIPVTVDIKYFQLLSPSYFQRCLKNIPAVIKDSRNPMSTSVKYNLTETKLIDGSITYPKDFREAPPAKVDQIAEDYVKGSVYSIEQFDSLSPKSILLFNLLIRDFKKHNVNIVFFLPPYHPIVYNVVERKYPMVIKTESYILKYAKMNSIKIYGSYNPRKVGLSGADFYDGMHCKEKGIKIILNRNYD
ncbi:MAG TPA: hypothetical protein VK705_06685 [Ferruginibacter sp.]|nr:hypothetical protein [Ferruginibacter sp.]